MEEALMENSSFGDHSYYNKYIENDALIACISDIIIVPDFLFWGIVKNVW